MNKLKLLSFFTVVFFLTACEYELVEENFLELTPPENSIPLNIVLNNISPNDTLCIYQYTSISLEINSSKNLLKAVVLIDGQEFVTLWNNSPSFVIVPSQLAEGLHTLTVTAVFSSGTGSLAELMGLEGYMGELSWNIQVVHDYQNHFNIGHRVNTDGFLEVFWDNVFPENFVEKYTVYSFYNHNEIVTIDNPSQKYFIDYGYVCGSADYQVRTYLKDGNSFLHMHYFSEPVPKVYFEDLGVHNLRVHWDKPFANGRFYLKEGEVGIALGINDTTITIPQIFGKNRSFSLEIRPKNASYDNSNNYFKTGGHYFQGISLGLPNNELYAYSVTENIIYTRMYDKLVALDANSMQELNSVTIMGNPWGFSYGGKIASAPHNSTVAAMTGEETWIFPDSYFFTPIIIPQLPGGVQTRLAALTSDDRFFVVHGNFKICKVFNALTGESVFDFPFTYNTIFNFPDFVTVSDDGQYFCASSENGIEVFEINGTTTNLLYTDTRLYKGAMFVPSQPDKLLLRVDSEIELRQIPGFSLIQSLNVSANEARLCNIDPASMSLLYHQNDSLKVCKISNLEETIFRIRSDEKNCKMFNNKLLTWGKGGMYFDISPFIAR